MKKTKLVFPTITLMADFILTYQINSVDACTYERTLSGVLSENLIVIACTNYEAVIKKQHQLSPL